MNDKLKADTKVTLAEFEQVERIVNAMPGVKFHSMCIGSVRSYWYTVEIEQADGSVERSLTVSVSVRPDESNPGQSAYHMACFSNSEAGGAKVFSGFAAALNLLESMKQAMDWHAAKQTAVFWHGARWN